MYIGQTRFTLEERWKGHISSANVGSRFPIHCAIRKYGPGTFLVCTISDATSLAELDELEKFFIQKYHSMVPDGYNRTAGGEGFQGPHTGTARQRMRTSHLGKKRSIEERQKQGATMAKIWATPDFRKKNKGRSGKSNSLKQRRLQSLAAKAQWADPIRRAKVMEGLRAQ